MSFFVVHSIYVFSSLFFFSIVYSTTTGRAGTRWNRTNASVVRSEGRRSGSTGACRVYDLFSTQFNVSSFHSSSFPLCAVHQQMGLGGTQRDWRGRRSNTGRDRGAGEREEEVEGWAAGLRKGVGGGRERGEQEEGTGKGHDSGTVPHR